jgi:hypothetical protein
MAGNSDFILVRERGWRRGLGNLLDNELSHWWKTRMWWIQCLIWGGITGSMLAGVIFGSAKLQLSEAVMIYCIFAGLFPAVGVVIIMQDTLVGEKQDGTAAWIMSKPVSRPAFILAKVIANSLGVLVTLVAVPAVLGYALLSFAAKAPIPALAFLAAIGVICLTQFFLPDADVDAGGVVQRPGAGYRGGVGAPFSAAVRDRSAPIAALCPAVDPGRSSQQPVRSYGAGADLGSTGVFLLADRIGLPRGGALCADRLPSV